MTDSSDTHLVGVAAPTLRGLRSAVLELSAPETAINTLREAGFAGGEAVFASFEEWVAESAAKDGAGSAASAGDLTLEQFGESAARFFRDAGWGDVSLKGDDDEGVAIVDIMNCWEGSGAGTSGGGCQITTGLLAAFFGRIAGYPVAVMETECCEGDESRCRFLMGNADVMNYKWEELR